MDFITALGYTLLSITGIIVGWAVGGLIYRWLKEYVGMWAVFLFLAAAIVFVTYLRMQG